MDKDQNSDQTRSFATADESVYCNAGRSRL